MGPLLIQSLTSGAVERCFVDRKEVLQDFERQVESFAVDPPDLRVLVYFGVGGIGKTALRLQMTHRVQELRTLRSDIDLVTCDLGSAETSRVSRALFTLRRQLTLGQHLLSTFDFALARLWAHEGLSIEDIRSHSRATSGLLVDLIELAAGAAGAFAPVSVLQKLWRSGTARAARYGAYRQLLDQIQEMDAGELEDRLPSFLGMAIAAASRDSGHRVCCMFDGYDEVVRRHARSDADRWLRELIASAGVGMYLLFSRHQLKWDTSTESWKAAMHQQLLRAFAAADAEELLRRQGVDDADARQSIVRFARGNPFALDICSQLYRAGALSLAPAARADRGTALARIVARYLKHLDAFDSEAVKACCVLRRFDQALWEALCRAVGVAIPVGLFDEFCREAYAEEAGTFEGGQLFRVNRTIRHHVLEQVTEKMIGRVLDAALAHASTVRQQGRLADTWWLTQDLLALIAVRPTRLRHSHLDQIAALALSLVHNGWWQEVGRALSTIPSAAREASGFAVVWQLLVASCERRRGDIRQAHRHLSQVQPTSGAAGVRKQVRYLAAVVRHKTGDYDGAEREYAALASEPAAGPFDWQPEFLAARKLADLCLVRGAFRDAERLLNRLAATAAGDGLWQSELLRLRGHVCRFNFLLEDALALYRQAHALAAEHRIAGQTAKALTNVAEAMAWLEPDAAMSAVEEAVLRNRELSAPIEVAKARAAAGVALALSRKPRQAMLEVEESYRMFEKAGYPAGRLFAMRAEALALLWRGEAKRAAAVQLAMRTLSQRLHVYSFLEFAIAYLHNDRRPPQPTIQWLDQRRTMAFLDQLTRKYPRGGNRAHQPR